METSATKAPVTSFVDREFFFTPVDDRSVMYRVSERAPKHSYKRADDETWRSAFASAHSNDGFEASDPGDILGPVAQLVGAPSVYTRRDEYPALDRMWDAYNREVVREKTEALAFVEEVVYGKGAFGEYKFDRKAGCSCGCSPGFRLKGKRGNLFIDVTRIAP